MELVTARPASTGGPGRRGAFAGSGVLRPGLDRRGGFPWSGRPPLIGRKAAQELAREELAKPIYHQGSSLPARIFAKIISFLQRLFDHANSAVPGGWWGLVALAVLAVLVAGIVLARIGPISRGHRTRGGAPLARAAASAREHRERADELAVNGDWTGAIRERMLAIARDLEERAILSPQAGRTADELAVEAGRALPGYGGALWSAARLFDDVYYGELPGTREGYAQLRQLDEGVHAARPVPLGALETAGARQGTA